MELSEKLPISSTETSSLQPSPRFRLLRVYLVGTLVLLDFAWFKIRAKFLGKTWRVRTIEVVQRRNSRRVVALILKVRGLFVKIGQMLSIMTNFLPEAFREDLEKVQDQVSPSPFSVIQQRLAAMLGGDPLAHFSEFERQPIAAASLAQVHRARLMDGRQVAVKIQHPDIKEQARRDLRTLKHMLWVGGLVSGVRGLHRVHQKLSDMVAEELDFRKEAANLEALAEFFEKLDGVALPEVLHDYSAGDILTTTFIDGIKISDVAALREQGLDPENLARRLLQAYCAMLFDFGLYHADPHPGNLLVQPDGTIIFLDFGAVSNLSSTMRQGMIQFLTALLRGDAEEMHQAMMRMGFIPKTGNEEVSADIIRFFQRKFLTRVQLESMKLEDIQADFQTKLDMIADIRDLGWSMREVNRAFQAPTEWVLLHRTIILLLGLTTHLDRQLNPVSVIRPYLERFILGKDRNWGTFLSHALKNALLDGWTSLMEARRAVRKLNQGELTVVQRPSSRAASARRNQARLQVVALFAALGTWMCYDAWSAARTELLPFLIPVTALALVQTLWLWFRRA